MATMVKPFRIEQPPQPVPVSELQFSHFGVLDDGKQSKASFVTSATINVILAAMVILLGLAAAKVTEIKQRQVAILVAPPEIRPAPPKLISPPIAPKLPPVPPKVAIEPPKISVPEVKAPEMPKPAVVKMNRPAPVIEQPAPPKRVVAPAAPVAVSLAHPQAASVPNNSAHPTAVALGRADNPIAPSNRPAVSDINLGQRGLAGMPASNSGTGPAATHVSLGSGSPGSGELAGNGTRGVRGVRLGVAGGTGSNNATGRTAGPVNLGMAQTPASPRPEPSTVAPTRSAPKVLYKPRPQYTAEAMAQHIEGTVSVRLRVRSNGAVEVLGVARGLGYGLDQSAENAVRGTRFEPAQDASGRPVDWEGIVNVAFQLAN